MQGNNPKSFTANCANWTRLTQRGAYQSKRGSQLNAAQSARFISERLERMNEVTKAEAAIKHAIRNAMNETVDFTGLRAGPGVDRLVDAILNRLLDPHVHWAVRELAIANVEA